MPKRRQVNTRDPEADAVEIRPSGVTARGKLQVERSESSRMTRSSALWVGPMFKYLVIAAFVLIASLAVYGVSVAPAAAAFDGYDHSLDSANAVRESDGEADY
jgi:hypothetical protein